MAEMDETPDSGISARDIKPKIKNSTTLSESGKVFFLLGCWKHEIMRTHSHSHTHSHTHARTHAHARTHTHTHAHMPILHTHGSYV
jgi:hypothetical protein